MTLHLLNKVIETGITPDTNDGIKPRIKVINSACLVGITATTVANATMYLTNSFSIYLLFAFILTFTIPLLCNHFKYYNASTLVLFIGAICAINWTMLSTPDKILYYFVAAAVLPYFFHGRLKRIMFLLLLIVLPFLVAKFFNISFYEPGKFRFAYFLISLGTILLMVSQFLKIKDDNYNLSLANIKEMKSTRAMISARKRKLEIMTRNLSKQNTELENLVYIASHDLKEPIRNTISYIQLLQKKNSDNLNSQQVDEIKKLEKNAYQINETITELLSYSQIGKVADFEPFDLDILLIECMVIVEKKFNTTLKVNHKTDISVYGNREDIKILFVELFKNSIKSNLNNSDLTFSIQADVIGNSVDCTFTDNGSHIPVAAIDKIQHKNFKDLERKNTADFGIAICKKIIFYHNGKMNYESNSNGGQTIHFTLNAVNPNSN